MRAVLAALKFSSPDQGLLARLSAAEWRRTLQFCDRAQLTLPLALRCRDSLPQEIRTRTDGNLAGNAERWRRIVPAYREVADALAGCGIEFAVLKGFSHCPDFISNPRWRPQYDFDLLLPPATLRAARDVAADLGYEALGASNGRVDHLPAMIRKTGWEWRGDLFDPEIPLALELHFRLWDRRTEHFEPSGLGEFWERRERRELEGLGFAAFHTVDALGYASLHLLRHLLRGDGKAFHVYEIASLLHRTADNDSFWSHWSDWHDPSLRSLEAICFSLAHRLFDCRLSLAASEEIGKLPVEVAQWLDLYAFSPLTALVQPNKHELWLHWSLIESRAARWQMLRRRLMPASLPGPVDAVHVPESKITWRRALRRKWRYARYVSSRVAHHIGVLPRVAMSAAHWFGGLTSAYWTFFLAAACFNFGLSIYFFLYNLYLLQLGFREDFLGLVSGVMTAGSVAGCIPAAAAMRRFGMRPVLLTAFAAAAGLNALRAVIPVAPVLVGLAFAAGFAGSAWAVAISPAVAQLTTERNRSLGLSLIFSSGVGIGVLGGFAGGHLPGRLLHVVSSNVGAYRDSLLCGCAMALLALWPLSRLRMEAAAPSEPAFRRPSPLLWRFFAAALVWNLGTGSFNPFFSAFFVHARLSTERIGVLFSGVQMAQALAMMAAPLVLRKVGLARGISTMQFATALSLAALAMFPGATPAALAYGAYMVAQYMSEPGVFALLMNSVPAPQRAGVSALNMIVMFAAQGAAAGAAGVLITRFGYPPVLTGGALICAVAALLFRRLRAERIVPSDP